jgi:hypothetical protein
MNTSKNHNKRVSLSVSTDPTPDAISTTEGSLAVGKKPRDYREAIREQDIKVKVNGLPSGVHLEDGLETSGRDKRLSPRATMFTGYVMEGHTPIVAYMKSYNCENSSHATITSNANKLMRDPRVTLLLEPLWQAKKEMILTDERIARKHIMAELFKHSKDDDTPISMKLRSLELMGKAVGLFSDKTDQMVEVIDVDALKKELESSLRLLENANKRKPRPVV